MSGQAPTHSDDSLRTSAEQARRSTKRVLNATRDLNKDLARLDEQLAEYWGFGFTEEPAPHTTTAQQGEGDTP